MTGNSPKLWAAADLDPISPSPVHPSSPITVPALQDQADAYVNMSLIGSNPIMTLAAATTAMARGFDNEQAHMPAAAVTAVTAHNNGPTNMQDTPPSHVGGADLEKEVDGVAKKTGTVSIGINAEDMQESETSRPSATEVEQDVSKSSESTGISTISTPMSDPADVATSIHKSTPPILQIPSATSPKSGPQPPHELQEDGQVVSDATSNVDNAQLSQLPNESPPANNSYYSGTTGHANHLAATIQALVGNIPTQVANADVDVAHIPASEGTSSSDALPQSIILPPKPPSTQAFSPTYEASQSNNVSLPLSNGLALSHYTGLAPGAYLGAVLGTADPCASATPIPDTTPMVHHVHSTLQSDPIYGSLSLDQPSLSSHKKQPWDTFLQEERKYVSEAKWDRFPEGSRLFIGNLSSERASKKEVFTIFSKYGRLAQISLKQAYGFVQYHTVSEGQAAMDNLQGMDIRGKKINLEFSRAQKKDGEGSRGNRGRRGGGDRQDSNRGRRDDYRPGRQPSPRRSNHRQLPSDAGNHRNRDYRESSYASDRRRSQSPGYIRHNVYRRRSLSPHRRYGSGSDLDLPRRYGVDVPDVQFLILQDVTHEFVSWAQAAFTQQGLRCDVMFPNPQFARDAIIQRQVLEGVHAVVELDVRAEQLGRLPLQVFDRSAGYDNVRFDQYQDLEPNIAAQLVTRSKLPSHMPVTSQHNGHYPPAQHYMPPPYPNQHYAPPMAHSTGGAPLDSATVHKILGSLNGQSWNDQQGGPPVNVNSLLSTLGTAPQEMGGPHTQRSLNYGHLPPNVTQGVHHGSNSARHVEDIMTQLSRYRQ